MVSHPTLSRNHTLQIYRHPPALHRPGGPRAMASRAGKERLTGLREAARSLNSPPSNLRQAPLRSGAARQAHCGANPDFASLLNNLRIVGRPPSLNSIRMIATLARRIVSISVIASFRADLPLASLRTAPQSGDLKGAPSPPPTPLRSLLPFSRRVPPPENHSPPHQHFPRNHGPLRNS